MWLVGFLDTVFCEGMSVFLDCFNSFCHLLGRWSFVNRLGVLEQTLILGQFDCVNTWKKTASLT